MNLDYCLNLKKITIAVFVSYFFLFAPQVFAENCPIDKFALWTGKYLRGANIFMGRNPEGGINGIGDGNFEQADFNDLRQAGANFVQLSHAGIFAESPPYALDQIALATLDLNILRARAAGLYVVIAFRSGPGRNENTITNRNGPLIERIWDTASARDAWVGMLRYTANRYRDNPVVVGYSIMVEPNAYASEGYIGPEEFYAKFVGTLKDVNRLHALASAAIREVDSNTPILLEPEGYGNINWLPYLRITNDNRTVYTPHDYSPFEYTHQQILGASYPGNYDINYDNTIEFVDKALLTNFLSPIRQFSLAHNVPVAITEFGVHRNASNSSLYLSDRIDIQNSIGSWAVWTWQSAGFIDPFNVHDASSVRDTLVSAWSKNCQPTFVQSNPPLLSIHGVTYYRGNRPIKGVKLYAGSKLVTSGASGQYAFNLTRGTYVIKALSKGSYCRIGSSRGPYKKNFVLNRSSKINIYCTRR